MFCLRQANEFDNGLRFTGPDDYAYLQIKVRKMAFGRLDCSGTAA